jgi:hypothetical protein
MKYKRTSLKKTNEDSTLLLISKKDAVFSGIVDGVINLIHTLPRALLLIIIWAVCIYFICKG